MRYRVHAEYRFETGQYGIWIGREFGEWNQQLTIRVKDWENTDPAVSAPPSISLDGEAARVLYDALGEALGLHLSDTKLAARMLERAEKRVDQFIEFLTEKM